VIGFFGVIFLKETYAPVLRLVLHVICSRFVLNMPYRRKYGYTELIPSGPLAHVLWVNVIRPVQLLTGSLICFMLSLYMAMYVEPFILLHLDQLMFGP
jgi:hypothetical protein